MTPPQPRKVGEVARFHAPGPAVPMLPSNSGQWVRYADHAAEVARLEEQVTAERQYGIGWRASAYEAQAREFNLRTVAMALVAKIEVIHADERYQGVWLMAHNHGMPYEGPNYQAEYGALRAQLAEVVGRGEGGGEHNRQAARVGRQDHGSDESARQQRHGPCTYRAGLCPAAQHSPRVERTRHNQGTGMKVGAEGFLGTVPAPPYQMGACIEAVDYVFSNLHKGGDGKWKVIRAYLESIGFCGDREPSEDSKWFDALHERLRAKRELRETLNDASIHLPPETVAQLRDLVERATK